MGIMRLAKTYPLEIMETASREALDKNIALTNTLTSS